MNFLEAYLQDKGIFVNDLPVDVENYEADMSEYHGIDGEEGDYGKIHYKKDGIHLVTYTNHGGDDEEFEFTKQGEAYFGNMACKILKSRLFKQKFMFDQDQLSLIVETVMNGSMEVIGSCLPPTISFNEFVNKRKEIENMIHGAKLTVFNTLVFFISKVKKDECENFNTWKQYLKIVGSYINQVCENKSENQIQFPNFSNIAKQFVENELNDCFN